MPTFSVEFEKHWVKRSKELGRDLTSEEAAVLEAELFKLWIAEGRLDDLIRTVHANHGREGGLEQIVVLGYHLRETKDADRIHSLFRGLISRRVKAFYSWWPRASTGHIGAMQDAAHAMAEAMDAYTEYFISLHKLELKVECDQLREEMKKFQAREKMAAVLPKAKKQKA